MKKHVVTAEFIEKSNGVYYPVDAIYEGNAQRCNELRELGYLGDEVKEPKTQQKQVAPENSTAGQGKAARGAGEKNEPGNGNEDPSK